MAMAERLRGLTQEQDARVGRWLRRSESLGLPPSKIGLATVYQIHVEANGDIQPQQSGPCFVLQGKFGGFNHARDNDGSEVQVDVYNPSGKVIDDGVEFPAAWTVATDKAEGDGWVAQPWFEEEDSTILRVLRAITCPYDGEGSPVPQNAERPAEYGPNRDGEDEWYCINLMDPSGRGDEGEDVIGMWDHATGGKRIMPDTEIWVQTAEEDRYRILGADCRGLVDP